MTISHLRQRFPLRLPGPRPSEVSGPGLGDAKPLLRGAGHALFVPVLLGAVIVLLLRSAPGALAANAVFALTALVLFTTSALYHRGSWSPAARVRLKRLDHSNIFALIAGTYTPFAVLLLSGTTQTLLLVLVWSLAALGILQKLVWIHAPRALSAPLYVGMGWVALGFLPAFTRSGGILVVALLVAGGIAYSLGALAYALRRPNPFPDVFGHHELHHAGTIVGVSLHYAAVLLANAV